VLATGLKYLLKLRFVKPAFYKLAAQIFDFVRLRYRKQLRRNLEDFFRPVAQILFAEQLSLHRHAHFVADSILSLVRFRLQRIQTISDDVLVVWTDFHRSHPDRSVVRVVVRVHEIVQHVHLSPRIRVGEISVHISLQSSVETLHDAGYQVLVFARVEMYAVSP